MASTRTYYSNGSIDESAHTTSSTSYQDGAYVTFTPDADSTYLILANVEIGCSSITYWSKARLYNSTSSTVLQEIIHGWNDTTDKQPYLFAVYETYGSSPTSQTIKFQYCSSNSGNTCSVRNDQVIVIKLTSNDKYASATTRSTTTSASYQDKATLTFTPGSEGDYYIIATTVWDMSSYDYLAKQQITIDGTAKFINDSWYSPQNENGTGRYLYTALQKSTLTAASHTIKTQWASDGSRTSGASYSYIIALRADELPGTSYSAYSDSTSTDTAGAWMTHISCDATGMSAASDYLVLSCAILGNPASTSYSCYERLKKGSGDPTTYGLYEAYYSGSEMPVAAGWLDATGTGDTFYIRFRAESSTKDTTCQQGRIFVLQLEVSETPKECTDSVLVKLTEGTAEITATEETSDSVLVKITEGVAEITTTIPARSDSVLVKTSETSEITATATGADTVSPTITEGAAEITATVAGSDTVSPTITEGAAEITATVAGSDSTLVKITEGTAEITATVTGADTLTVTISEVSEVAQAEIPITGADSITITVTESAAEITGVIECTDTLTLTATEGTTTITASVPLADTLTLTVTETATEIIPTLPTRADTLTVTLTDSVVGKEIQTADTITITVTETETTVASLLTVSDTILVLISEGTPIKNVDATGSDTLLVTVTEGTPTFDTIAVTASDSLTISANVDSGEYIVGKGSSDTLTITITEESGGLLSSYTACVEPIRRIHAKVKITYSDPQLDEGITVTATNFVRGTDPDDTADNVLGSAYKWFQLYDSTDGAQRNDLSGDYHPMPSDGSVGWWSTTLSDANGAFSPGSYPTLTVVLEDVRPVYDIKVYGDDQLDIFPRDFNIYLYDETDTLLDTYNKTGNTDVDWWHNYDEVIDNVKKLVLEVTKIGNASAEQPVPYMPCIVTEFFTAYTEEYQDNEILYLSLLEERDFQGATIPIGNVSSNEITVRIANIDDHFTHGNLSSPIRNLIKKNRKIEAWLGVEVPYGGTVEWEKMGVFWSQDWNVPRQEIWAETVGLDRLELLRGSDFATTQVYTDYTLAQLAEVVFTDAGLTAAEYSIDSALSNYQVPYTWFGRTTHRAALVEIAEACLGTVYCNREGVIVIEPYQDQESPQCIVTSDTYFDKTHPIAFSEIVNFVEVQATPRLLVADYDVYVDTTVDEDFYEGEEMTLFCIYNTSGAGTGDCPALNHHSATITQSGTGIEILSQTDYTWASEISLKNNGTGTQTLTGIGIVADVLIPDGNKVATAQDDTSIRLNGRLALTEPIQNNFIQTKLFAQNIADDILAAYKDPRRDTIISHRGYTGLKLGQRISVNVYTDEVRADYTVIRQFFEYDGGLRVEITGQKIAGSDSGSFMASSV